MGKIRERGQGSGPFGRIRCLIVQSVKPVWQRRVVRWGEKKIEGHRNLKPSPSQLQIPSDPSIYSHFNQSPPDGKRLIAKNSKSLLFTDQL
jgi:hypothetical protein